MQFSSLPSLVMGTTEKETQSSTAPVMDAVTMEEVAPFDTVFFTFEMQTVEGATLKVNPNSTGVDADDLAPWLEGGIDGHAQLLDSDLESGIGMAAPPTVPLRSEEILPAETRKLVPTQKPIAWDAASSEPVSHVRTEFERIADKTFADVPAAQVMKERGETQLAVLPVPSHFPARNVESSARVDPKDTVPPFNTEPLAKGEKEHLEKFPANKKQPRSEGVGEAKGLEHQLEAPPQENSQALESKAVLPPMASAQPVMQMSAAIETVEVAPPHRGTLAQVQTDAGRLVAQPAALQTDQMPVVKVDGSEGRPEGARPVPAHPVDTDLSHRSSRPAQPEFNGQKRDAQTQQSSATVGGSGSSMTAVSPMSDAGLDQEKAIFAVVQPLDVLPQDRLQDDASLRVLEQISTGSNEIKTGTVQRLPDLPRGIAVQIADVLRQNPDRPMELTLSPEELGRLRMSFQSDGSSMQVTLSFERPDTLDLMRRHIDQLARDMQAFGITDVSFTFQQQTFGDGAESSGDESAPHGGSEPQKPSSSPIPDGAVPIMVQANGAMGVDIRL